MLVDLYNGSKMGGWFSDYFRSVHHHSLVGALDLGIYEARDLAQSRPLWRLMSLHSALHSWWCMLLHRGAEKRNHFSFFVNKSFNMQHNLNKFYYCYC